MVMRSTDKSKIPFSCVVIGRTTLAVACVEKLAARGHRVSALVAPTLTPDSSRIAASFKIPVVQSIDELLRTLGASSVDYLFSIVNPTVLDQSILSRAARRAINFHDAPLPRYAGAYATTWAIMAGETRHGVTWHEMTSRIDGGNVLKAKTVTVDGDETAFSLNAKCYQAALDSFGELLGDLEAGRDAGSPQDVEQRSYFARYRRPGLACTIDWRWTTSRIDQFVRALDFGGYDNPIGIPKIRIDDAYYLCRRARVEAPTSGAQGTLLAVGSDELTVATSDGSIALSAFATLDGMQIAVDELVSRHGIRPGIVLPPFNDDEAGRIAPLEIAAARSEAASVALLAELRPANFAGTTYGSSSADARERIDIPLPLGDEVAGDAASARRSALAAFVSAIARSGPDRSADVLLEGPMQHELYRTPMPLRVKLDPHMPLEAIARQVQDAMDDAAARGPIAADVGARYRALRVLQSSRSHVPSIVTTGDLDSSLQTVAFHVTDDGRWAQLSFDPSHVADDAARNVLQRVRAGFVRDRLASSADVTAETPVDVRFPFDNLVELFASTVRRSPQATALASGDRRWTYAEVDARTNRLARRLQALGVKPGALVGFALERSIEAIVAMVAIGKAGAAYVPFATDQPIERLARQFTQSGCVLLLARRSNDALTRELPVVLLDDEEAAVAAESPEALDVVVSGDALAYVLFTSGSTGDPKGVAITHASIANYTQAIVRELSIDADACLQFAVVSTLTSDLGYTAVYPAIASGATLHVVAHDTATDPERFARYCAVHPIDVLKIAPSHFDALCGEWSDRARAIAPRRTLVLGGERLSWDLVDRIRSVSNCEIRNHYGPTEGTVGCATYRVDVDLDARSTSESVPVGKPLANVRLFVLDEHRQLVDPGAPGELCIAGAGLARGYHARADLTAERFVDVDGVGRVYLTGDRVRELPGGDLEFLGRNDDQIKIRGFRVEPGEIEAALREYPGVAAAAVIAEGMTSTRDPRLIAFIVPQSADAAAPASVRDWLRGRLPDYLLPNAISTLDRLPYTSNGKLDRAVLRTFVPAADDRTFVAPQTPVEAIVADAWADILELPRVGRDENVFELGANSLSAIRVLGRLADRLSVALPLRAVFEEPTVAALARRIAGATNQASTNGSASPGVRGRDEAPLSHAQELLWLLDRAFPGLGAYNISEVLLVKGALDLRALQAALNDVAERQTSLRTAFFERDGEPYQRVMPVSAVPLRVVDKRGASDAEVDELVRDEVRVAFDLTRAPLIRALAVWRPDATWTLTLVHPHIVSDGWSRDLILAELAGAYERHRSGDDRLPVPLAFRSTDHAAEQREALRGEALDTLVGYWRERLLGAPEVLELPTDRPRPPTRSFDGAVQRVLWPAHTLRAAKRFAQAHGTTLFMALLAAFEALLARYSGQDDFVIGSPVAGRARVESEEAVGYFANMLPLRADLSGDPSFRALVKRVQAATVQDFEHDSVPFEALVTTLGQRLDPARAPIFHVAFALEGLPAELRSFGGAPVVREHVHGGFAKYDLWLTLGERADGLSASIEYRTDLFDAITVERLLEHLHLLLEGALADPDRALSALPMITAREREESATWNATGERFEPACVHQLIEAQCARTPNAVAVRARNGQLSYAELDARATRLAEHLSVMGIGRGDLVGIFYERSIELIVALVGVLKAGAAYVPLDPAYPPDRIAFMLHDSAVRLVLADSRLHDLLPTFGGSIVTIEQLTADATTVPQPALVGASPEDLAYVIYTSGSTGEPKGAMLPHRAVANYLQWMQNAFPLDAGDRVLLKAPVSFDASVWEFYLPLISGARLVLAGPDDHHNPAALAETIASQRITVIQFVPSLIGVMLESPDFAPACRFLRLLFLGGEAVSPELATRVRAALPNVDLHNLYGPTEAAVYATAWTFPPSGPIGSVSIGAPIANVAVHVLDPTSLLPVPVGVVGELCISGAGLATGYLKRPELTASRFVRNPSAPGGARMYRTGDLGRWRRDGTLECLGRIDQQVKIRGFRVELGEVEATLSRHPVVRECVVANTTVRGKESRLTAYVVLRDGANGDRAVLREFLAAVVPEYMLPDAFVFLDAMPLGITGKLDRKALPAPDDDDEPQQSYVAPRTDLERIVAMMWANVLGRSRIGAFDNFFSLGGHSLGAMRILVRLAERLSVPLSFKVLLEAPTVAALAQRIAAMLTHEPQASRNADALRGRDESPLSYAQDLLWLMNRAYPGLGVYNIIDVFRVEGTFDAAAFQDALTDVTERQTSLRTSFSERDGEPYQRVMPVIPVPVRVVEMTGATDAEIDLAARNEVRVSFDLECAPLLRALVIVRGAGSQTVVLVHPHIVSDGWSRDLLLVELGRAYARRRGRDFAALPPLDFRYTDFAAEQREALRGEQLETLVRYWQDRLEGAPDVLEVPTDRPRPPVRSFEGDARRTIWPHETLRAAKHFAQAHGTTLYRTLLASFQALLYRYSGQDDFVIGSPIARRTRKEHEPVVGYFVNMLPLRADVSGDPSFSTLLDRVRESTMRDFEHIDIPFEVLVTTHGDQANPMDAPLFQVTFALDKMPAPLVLEEAVVTRLDAYPGSSKYDLALLMSEVPEGLRVSVEYRTDLFDAVTIDRLVEHLRLLIETAVAAPDQPISTLPLITQREREAMAAWNATAKERPDLCVHELIEAQAVRTPDAVAVRIGEADLTYRALNERADRLAARLRERGVRRGDFVGVCIERSHEMMIAFLAVFKAGGAYIPLDSENPPERLRLILEDAQPRIVLTLERQASRVPAGDFETFIIDADNGSATIPGEVPEIQRAGLDDLAYVLYTSGSTGTPKGVMVSHRGLADCLLWLGEFMPFGPGVISLQMATITFDLSVAELFSPLCFGATIVMALPRGQNDVHYAVDLLLRERISAVQIVPSMLRLFLDVDAFKECVHLEHLFIGGEALSPQLVADVRRVLPHARLSNGYGPTEATIYATAWPIPEEPTVISIGAPKSNTLLYVLSPQQYLQPIGVPGELYIGGTGVAFGYLRRETLTAERFIDDPFSAEPGARMYRTGDRVRWRDDGTIEFFGRVDDQVKINGVRVELGEIENALLAQPSVSDAAVTLYGDPETGGRRLCAYVVGNQGRAPRIEDVRAGLAQTLPIAVIPSVFVPMDALPLTPSRKVDRRALPSPAGFIVAADRRAPQTATERLVFDVWADVLGHDRFGADDSFFAIGGNSLYAMRAMVRLENRLAIRLPVRRLFETQTLARFATAVDLELARGDEMTDVEALLGELDLLSDEEADRLTAGTTSEL